MNNTEIFRSDSIVETITTYPNGDKTIKMDYYDRNGYIIDTTYELVKSTNK